MKNKAQVVLESALVLIAMSVFVVLIMRSWVWFVHEFQGRWNAYNGGRVAAGTLATYGTNNKGYKATGYNQEKLIIFPTQ